MTFLWSAQWGTESGLSNIMFNDSIYYTILEKKQIAGRLEI